MFIADDISDPDFNADKMTKGESALSRLGDKSRYAR